MSTLAVNSVTDANSGNTATINGMTPTADSLQGFRNRILNGNMVLDQRNAGASVATTTTAAAVYSLDRWAYLVSAASKFTIQQNAGSVTPPAGFTNYLGCTSLSAYSITSGDYFYISQRIEGYNISDLMLGSAGAKTFTISFWVRSSLTGTFGGALRNGSVNRSYPFEYTISSANTWEKKSIVVNGDTTGTWLTTNGTGLDVIFSIGMGSTYSNTAGTWVAGNYASVTGATSVVGTSGATWYITGVQLEVGSVATPFERRDYGREFILCQRYYQNTNDGSNTVAISSWTNAGTNYFCSILFPVAMRAAPTMTYVHWTSSGFGTTGAFQRTGKFGTNFYSTANSSQPSSYILGSYTASAEL